jgi:hypothetical protein
MPDYVVPDDHGEPSVRFPIYSYQIGTAFANWLENILFDVESEEVRRGNEFFREAVGSDKGVV